MKSCLVALAVMAHLALASPLLAQEAVDNEELRELDKELRAVERRKNRLSARIHDLDTRLDLLRRARKLKVEAGRIETQLERAEEQGDEAQFEKLEPKLESTELNLEEVFARLELLDKKGEISELREELREEGLAELAKRAERLLQAHGRAEEALSKLFQAYREGNESKAGPLEERLEAFEEQFERQMRELHLKLELHFAREEDDDEAMEELERELQTLDQIERLQEGAELDLEAPKAIRPSESEIDQASRLSLSDRIAPMLRTHCFECHDDSSAAGDLNLQRLLAAQPLVTHRDDWLNVIAQLQVRSMPPAEASQPSESDRRTLAAFLTAAIERFDYSTVRQPGYEPARRLTHDEYNHTIRDLLGVDLRPADSFPDDLTASSGFENSANSLFIQPIMMERYIGAAESVAWAVLPDRTGTDEGKRTRERMLAGGTARQAVARLATRAYRRPLEREELAGLHGYFDRLVAAGSSSDQALRQTLQVILISPSFLMRSERDRQSVPDQPFRVSDYELASRLSYFLWASMPDQELFRLAADGSLSQPGVLRDQVARMLKDERSTTLGSIFASQWLGFAELQRVPRDQIENPWATDSLIAAMQDESALLFHSLIQDNAPIERLISADYTYLNEELAEHYQIDGVRGSQLRRVSLADTQRGGILGQGSILAITSHPRRASPVKRGNWLLSELLGTPPPPPPPNVSEFNDRIAENESLTERQKLMLHRRNPNCYACHSEIDPLGFALSQFDWFGRHRPRHRGKPIDAKGKLPSGTEVVGLAGLQQAIINERRDDLVHQVSRKMLSYALGRQLQYYDQATVNEIVADVQADQRRIGTLIHAIVASQAFQMKQLPKE